MTPKEHALMVLMLTRQALILKTLLDILKARKIFDESDVEAFSGFVDADQVSDPTMSKRIAKVYDAAAKALNLDTGLTGVVLPSNLDSQGLIF